MSANTQLRLASVCAAAYGALAVSGVIHHFQRTGSLRALVRGFASPDLLVVLLVAGLVAWGLWQRYAWAWWLGLAAAGYQLFRIVSGYVQSPVFGHLPRSSVLVSFTLLLLIVVLLLQRKARSGANR
jgi:benzodiazapine receptor